MVLTACTQRRHWIQRPTKLAIGTLNTQGGQGFGLEQAIWVVEHEFFDVMLMTKTKIQSYEYSQNLLG